MKGELTAATSTITLPARLDHLSPVLAYTRNLAAVAGFAAKEQQEMELAVEEIFANVVEHGFEYNSGETFSMVFAVSPAGLTITFQEKGVPFDPAALPQYDPEKASGEVKGLGIYLASRSVDEVSFRYLGQGGKETRLFKQLRRQPGVTPLELTESVPHTAFEGKYEIRLFRPDDALPVARCAYRAYGYTYSHHVYDPQQMVADNRQGTLISLVAVADDYPEALGYADLRPYGAIAEVESIFVNPTSRNSRVFPKLLQGIVQVGRERGYVGVFCLSVTSHVITQKAARFMNGVDCGLLVAYMPQTEFKSMGLECRHRVSMVMAFANLTERQPVTVYPPARHRAIVEKLYQALQMPVAVEAASPDVVPAAATLYSLDIHLENIAVLTITDYGSDAPAVLAKQLGDCCRQGIDCVYLYLDLQNPPSTAVAEYAQQAGFCFAGVLPAGIAGRDALVLQYWHNTEVSWEEIKLANPLAHELLAYIRSDAGQ